MVADVFAYLALIAPTLRREGGVSISITRLRSH